MARRSGRFKAVAEDADEDINVEVQVNDTEERGEEGVVDEMDDEEVGAGSGVARADGYNEDKDDEDDGEEEKVEAIMDDPAVPHDDEPDHLEVEVDVEVGANTSIGSTRPSRKAAQEATKRIEAGKIKIEDHAIKKGKGKGKARVLSDSESEEEETPKEVKGKGKAKGKGKGKKVQEIPSDAESEFEVETKPLKGGKKQILAKAVYWKDIPIWTKGSKSLLMELPGDIMDNIFGLREELGLAEYVALAGVCKTFRHVLDDDFFQGICRAKGHQSKTFRDPDTQSWLTRPEAKGQHRATAPFSRDKQDWRVEPPRKYTYKGNEGKLELQLEKANQIVTHYIPRGERPTWSKAQYTVYKEEKRACRDERWKNRQKALDVIARDIIGKFNSKWKFIQDGNRNRSLLGQVVGRKDGQPAVEKDEKGLPVVEVTKAEEKEASDDVSNIGEDQEKVSTSEGKGKAPHVNEATRQETIADMRAWAAQLGSCESAKRPRPRKRAHISESEASEEDTVDSGKKPKNKKTGKKRTKNTKQRSRKEWVVPDSSNSSADELEYMRGKGLKVVHDYWPSPWRVMAASIVNSDRINKTNALKTFKVTEAQLMTLSHVLVPNAMNSRQPTQLYLKTAVQALALRAHGGIAKHGALVEQVNAKNRARMSAKWEREDEARENGTFVHKRKCRPGPHWLYWTRANPNICYCEYCYGSDFLANDMY